MQFNLKGGYVMLSGIAGDDVKINTTQTGKTVANIRVQIAKYGDPAKWVSVTGWQDVVEPMRYIKKGNKVLAIGTTYEETYTAKDGTPKTEKKLNAEIVYCPATLYAPPENMPPVQSEPGELADEEDDTDLPF